MKFNRSHRHLAYSFFALDVVVWIGAFCLAFWIRNPNQFPGISPDYVIIMPLLVLVWLFCFSYFTLYNTRMNLAVEVVQLFKAHLVGVLLLLTLSFFYRDFSYSRIIAALFALLAFGLNVAVRICYQIILRKVLHYIRWNQNILVLGCGIIGQRIINELLTQTSEYQVIGFLDDQEKMQNASFRSVPCLGKIDDLATVLDVHTVDKVIIAFTTGADTTVQKLIEICIAKEVAYGFVPKMLRLMLPDIRVDVIAEVPVLSIKGNNLTGVNYILKRIFDTVVATIILIMISPVMLITALLIKVFSPGPVFYVQKRFGYRKEPFNFIKFRSMHVNNDESVHKEYIEKWINGKADANLHDGETTVYKLTKDSRIIPVIGSFIRKFSIDELPQLFNVIKGDMSLVGPRPCLQYEIEQYKQWHKGRFDALPGITGLWQVSGRNRVTFDEMVRLDIYYLQNWSFGLDMMILMKTPLVVLFDKAY